ncbi:hypothetical protein ACHBTE_06040 [Streptomyces sp. M41]|uniref:hypothetical protein n=1 Tax=Streptomyces sp. M41 TaxID=3059412 RepID=UPI00374D2D31
MTTDLVMEARERAGAVGGVEQSYGFTAQGRPTTRTVSVIPLWERQEGQEPQEWQKRGQRWERARGGVSR